MVRLCSCCPLGKWLSNKPYLGCSPFWHCFLSAQLVLPGISSQINSLPSNPWLRSASEKTPTHSEKSFLGSYRTTSHFFDLCSFSRTGFGQSRRCSAPLMPTLGELQPQSHFSVLGAAPLYSWKNPWAWTTAGNTGSHSKY